MSNSLGPMDCPIPGFPVLHYLLEFTQIHVHWVSDAIWPSHSLLPSSLLPSIFPSIRFFSNEFALWIRWPKYRSFSFSRSPSNEYSDLISFRMDWFDLLAVQEILKSFFSTTIWEHQFFSAQPSLWPKLSHLYMTTGKTITLSIWTLISKVMFLHFKTLPRSVIPFLPRNKHLLNSWLQLPSQWFWSPRK